MKRRGPNLSRWTSPQAEQRFRAMEDAFWHELWPEPPAAFDVNTALGTTRAYGWPGAGRPVVFLHGVGGTSIIWTGYVSEIDGRTAYAIDTIGDVGRSVQRTAVDNAGDLARWLAQVLDALGLDRVHLAGNSYGGFLALHLAAAMPERVHSIALFDPVGLVPVQLGRFMRWGFAIGLASLLPQRLRAI